MLYNDKFTLRGSEAYITQVRAASNQSIYAGTHFTDFGRIESSVKFSVKKVHPNIQPLTKPGIERGTLGMGGRDLNHCANPSAIRLTL